MRFAPEKLLFLAYFLMLIIVGTILLSLNAASAHNKALSLIDAFFISTSVVCVTGLSTVAATDFSNFGLICIMLLMELGGLGIVTFSTIYIALPKKKISLAGTKLMREYFVSEIEYRPRKIIKSILLTTICFQAIGALLLYGRFASIGARNPAFNAVFHSISAFCNAGFSTFDDSLASFKGDAWVLSVVAILIVAGGLGFVVLRDIAYAMRQGGKRLSFHSKLVLQMSAALIVLGALLYMALEGGNSMAGLQGPELPLNAVFHSVTARTAGFNTVDVASMSDASKLGTMALMLIGGSPGSIAGGIKTTTFLLVLIFAFKGLGSRGLKHMGRSVSPETSLRAISFFIKALALLAAIVFALVIAEGAEMSKRGFSFIDLAFEAFSAFGTVGLSAGLTSSLGIAGKLIIIAAMFAGRVGLFTFVLAQGEKSVERFVDYPSAEVLVG
jgi:trk system potassium uptake protein TrkH